MSLNENNFNGSPKNSPLGKTIDLQGVAAFASLVELLAQELGTAAGKMHGLLPNGPNSFDELVGEFSLNSQGFQRSVTLYAQPNSALRILFKSGWSDTNSNKPDEQLVGCVEAQFYLDATVEQILPQGRALARHIEDAFKLLDRMVTLGKSSKLAAMSVSTADLEAFERSEDGKLVKNFLPPTK